jgi:hypothetical protein
MSIYELIKKYMLDDYTRMRNSVTELTLGNPDLHKVLTGAAIGDAKVNSSFKKARVSYEKGMDYIDELCDLGVIELESSMQHLTNKKDMQKDMQKDCFYYAIFEILVCFYISNF